MDIINKWNTDMLSLLREMPLLEATDIIMISGGAIGFLKCIIEWSLIQQYAEYFKNGGIIDISNHKLWFLFQGFRDENSIRGQE